MILVGDEFGNTQYGNNNPYCRDNKISWLDWNDLKKNQDLYQFFKKMIALRKNHPVSIRTSPATPIGYPAISIHGTEAWNFDSSAENRVVGVMFTGKTRDGKDDFIYPGVNAHRDAHEIWLPALPQNVSWKVAVNTDLGDNSFYNEPINLNSSQKFLIGPRSVIICTN